MIDYNTLNLYNRRGAIIITGQIVLTSILIIRLFYLQVVKYDFYLEKAKNNSFRIQVKIPVRGEIYSSDNQVISKNINTYRIYIIPEEVEDIDSLLSLLIKELKINKNDSKNIYKRLNRQAKFQQLLIKEINNWDILAKLQIKNISGLYFEKSFDRYYTLEESGAQIFGYTVADKNNLFLLQGVTGLEKTFNKTLMGTLGKSVNIVNASGRVISEDLTKSFNSVDGENIKTTINYKLQKKLYDLLAYHKSACGVILDIKTGNVLSMASYPSFNPNKFKLDNGDEYIKKLNKDIYKPFMNKTIEGLYPPGSIFKIVVALAGLESGAINPYKKIKCNGYWNYKDRRYHCWKKEGHGSLDLIGALKHSCDIYFYQIALQIGIDSIRNMALKLGYSQKFFENIFVNEAQGVIPEKEWKNKITGVNWFHGDTILSGIGQGFILSNCLQNAVMLARTITNKKIIPNIIYNNKLSNFDNLNLNKKNIDIVLKGLNEVVKKGGTASNAYINVNGQKMGGKTGTSQVRTISLKERESGILKNEQILWNKRNHGLFVGYAPINKPKYIVSIITEHSGSSSTASNIASLIMKELLQNE